MHIQIKSSNGVTLLPLETRLLASRKIFIEGEINEQTACEFVKQVLHLYQEDPQKPIDVFINSAGGEINSGLLIYDVIQNINSIRIICIGKCHSMAALLLASGAKGSRFMLPSSELMLHQPMLGNRVGGNCSSLKSISDSLQETKRRINQILAKHTGKSEEEIEEATCYDHYFSPEESVAFGLCDEIIGFDKVIEA